VFATRSTFRPNPIGLTAARLDHIAVRQGQVTLHLAGVDLLDGTPVLDIKPYLPYADRIVEAVGGFAAEAPETGLAVEFSPAASEFCAAWPGGGDLRELISQILRQDPRPAYERVHPTPRLHGMKLHDLDVRWETRDEVARVIEIVFTAGEHSTALRRRECDGISQ